MRQICALRESYAAENCNSVPTFRDKPSVPSSTVKQSKTLSDRTKSCQETITILMHQLSLYMRNRLQRVCKLGSLMLNFALFADNRIFFSEKLKIILKYCRYLWIKSDNRIKVFSKCTWKKKVEGNILKGK